ncbi:SF-assemblin/beta-giardin like protein [Aduncisulcus paluster]|uniref:SF-assemblin/beta-giardin like protein n=1 Tax=Aduncisulcus paluster TaxID=2918883 RepID=A0ABQ5K2B8_9EUKA|nr:SF-assemblin/beta-giardin like protein [Aduncisulcus paluster]|eukprot:gnl/Carplike_NY0171/5009_a6834_380.p1 GENE.gnl/Carplike_NY0171/5009_a6834_380~~gnl/Carplike_NY0171/5009_a6834_380.p1  ORF type:complete len:271 (-),score=83.60 gnl/Carplike_NY0171/5009_a6834_380:114-926(-)
MHSHDHTLTPMKRSMRDVMDSPAHSRLSHIPTKTQSFSSKVESQVKTKVSQDERSIKEIRDRVCKLDSRVSGETEDRKNMLTTVYQSIMDHLKRKVDEMNERIRSTNEEIEGRITQLKQRAIAMDEALRETHASREKDRRETREAIDREISQLQGTLAAHKRSRLQHDVAMVKKITDEVFSVNEKIEEAKALREKKISELKARMEAAQKKSWEKIEDDSKILEHDVTALIDEVEHETRIRAAGEERVIESVQTIANKIQDGVKMLSRGTR